VFTENLNCDLLNGTEPLNAWGHGVVQQELIASVGNDPSIIALGLGEAWAPLCASPEAIRQVLGWKGRTQACNPDGSCPYPGERNGVALIARHGLAGPEEWKQLETSQNPNPADTMWVVRTPVCLDGGCTRAINIFTAHWFANGGNAKRVYEVQAQQTVDFMGQLPSTMSRLLIGDLNVWEARTPSAARIRTTRRSGSCAAPTMWMRGRRCTVAAKATPACGTGRSAASRKAISGSESTMPGHADWAARCR
jgi:hypothetical protein